jgi:hypothetical protein
MNGNFFECKNVVRITEKICYNDYIAVLNERLAGLLRDSRRFGPVGRRALTTEYERPGRELSIDDLRLTIERQEARRESARGTNVPEGAALTKTREKTRRWES